MIALVNRRTLLVGFGASAALLACGGCEPKGPAMGEVSGSVKLDDRPLAGAVVLFVPKGGGRPATGTTDAEGQYHLTTFAPGDGAIVGLYAVTISKPPPASGTADRSGLAGAAPRSAPPVASPLPQSLAAPETSGLTAEVKPGSNRCDFAL